MDKTKKTIDPSALIDSQYLSQEKSSPKTKLQINQWIRSEKPAPFSLPIHLSQPQNISLYAPVCSLLATQIQEELEKNISCLLSLNRSRRKTLLLHLRKLANLPSTDLTNKNRSDNHSEELQQWIYSPRSPEQSKTLKTPSGRCKAGEHHLIGHGR